MGYHLSYLILDVFWFIVACIIAKVLGFLTNIEEFKIQVIFIFIIYIVFIAISTAFGYSFFYLEYFFPNTFQ